MGAALGGREGEERRSEEGGREGDGEAEAGRRSEGLFEGMGG